MKKVLLVLLVAVALLGCEREVNVDITVPPCEDGSCEGAIIQLAPQARGPVDRGTMYAWIDVITVVAEDINGVDYGAEFELVDDGSGADGFYLETVPAGETVAFSASSTSKDDGAGEYLEQTSAPDNLGTYVTEMPFAEYATPSPEYVYIENGENVVYLNMYTDHGRLISSFQIASNYQSSYDLVVTKEGTSVTVSGVNGVVSYYNDETSVDGVVQTFTAQLLDKTTGNVAFERTITETVVASTSITSKYVVGLGFVEDTTTEVIFIWQPWVEDEGEDETDGLSTNGLDCGSCGTVTDWSPNGSYALTGDTVLNDVNLVVNGDINLNGHTLTVTCGTVYASSRIQGSGTIIAAGDITANLGFQNQPTVHANECF